MLVIDFGNFCPQRFSKILCKLQDIPLIKKKVYRTWNSLLRPAIIFATVRFNSLSFGRVSFTSLRRTRIIGPKATRVWRTQSLKCIAQRYTEQIAICSKWVPNQCKLFPCCSCAIGKPACGDRSPRLQEDPPIWTGVRSRGGGGTARRGGSAALDRSPAACPPPLAPYPFARALSPSPRRVAPLQCGHDRPSAGIVPCAYREPLPCLCANAAVCASVCVMLQCISVSLD